MHVSGIFLYPVKSLRGLPAAEIEVDEFGFAGDRRFLVVDENGVLLTQRALPRMTLIETKLDAHTLTLTRSNSAGGEAPLQIPRQPDATAPLRSVSVWKSEGLLAEDCGDEAATWLGNFLGTKCRLVRLGPAMNRPLPDPPANAPATRVSFVDAYPMLVIGESSLGDLNDRLLARGEEAVPMNRFRPNLVVSGSPPFAEDAWPRVRIGGIVFRAAGPCSRCVMTTTDQLTAERGHEPLRTLSLYRRDPAKPADVNFGQNLIHETRRGTLRVGDVVEVLS